MLHQLRSRLHAANFDVHFAIVTSEPSDDETLVALTRASGGIPLVAFETLPESFAVRSGWNRYSNDVMVVDSCGRVTYQVVMPWSSLQFPYVKAAVVSTLLDQPCGPCNGTEKKHKVAESHALNTTLHEMKDSRDKTQSKLVSIVNQYKPQSQIKETTQNTENVREAVEDIGDVLDNVTEANESKMEAPLIQDEQTPLVKIANATEQNSQSNVEDTHSVLNEDSITATETSEKVSKGKKKLKGKKNRSKSTRKQARDDEITDERNPIPSFSDAELEKAIYSSVENTISSEVTLAPLRETKDGLIPIRVIMRSPHEHDGKNYDYLEMQLGNPGYHGHLHGSSSENELEDERKELQLVEDDFDAIGDEDKMLEEKQKNDDGLTRSIGDGDDIVGDNVDLNQGNDDGEKKAVNYGSVIDAVKIEESPTRSEAFADNKDKEEAKETPLKPDGNDKSKDAKKKHKKTEKGDKKAKGNKTKLTNIPEQDWMDADIKDIPDKFDDIYPQVNDFANDVQEEESNHKNGEMVLDDLSITDLKHLIEEMGLEVDGNSQPVRNDSVVLESIDNKNENEHSNVDTIKDSEVLHNATEQAASDKKEHHKTVDSLSVTEKADKVKDLKGKESVTKDKDSEVTHISTEQAASGKKEHHKSANSVSVTEKADKVKDLKEESVTKDKNSDEIVAKNKVTLVPTLSDSESESTSASGGSSTEVMEHYSKLLPWLDYHL